MKHNASVLAAVAVSIVSVQATPVTVHARAPGVLSDPFVKCLRQTYPNFPKEGSPTGQEIQTCSDQSRPRAKRDTVPPEPITGESKYVLDNTTQVLSRGLLPDTAKVLDQVLSLGMEPSCKEKDDSDSTLHDEFVWADDVVSIANEVCDQANRYMEDKGINDQYGGGGYTSKDLYNAHDDQGNRLLNGRHLLLTVATTVYPPLGVAVDGAKAVAAGLHTVCSAGMQKLLNPQNGCTRKVDWYVSQKAKFQNKLVAIGGVISLSIAASIFIHDMRVKK
tara:strand:+ start:381 stop:1211 length:831 start_codon:yes stop_codon:yes gene_type:complete